MLFFSEVYFPGKLPEAEAQPQLMIMTVDLIALMVHIKSPQMGDDD